MSMSVGSVSTSSVYQYGNNSGSQKRQDFNALSQALQSGDLSGAQAAFSSMTQKFQGATAPTASASSTDDKRAADFSQLSDALKTGDLGAAQKAFASLKQDAQSVSATQNANTSQQSGQVHRHHHRQAASASTSNANSSQTDGTTVGGTIDVTA